MKCADKTARMRRLVCAFVARKPSRTGNLASRPICAYCVIWPCCIRGAITVRSLQIAVYLRTDTFFLTIILIKINANQDIYMTHERVKLLTDNMKN